MLVEAWNKQGKETVISGGVKHFVAKGAVGNVISRFIINNLVDLKS